jgi:hypothetical protein
MRDVHHFTQPRVETTYWDGSVKARQTLNPVILSSQRSDPIATPRQANGTYIFPTEYEAFFSHGSSVPATAIYREYDYSPDWRTVTVESEGYDDRGLYGYGCSNRRPSIPSAVTSLARSRALEAIRTNDFNLATFAGEIKDTVRTVSGLLGDIASIVKGRGRRVSLGDEWLRYQYGIKPLMSDIDSLIRIIKNGMDQPLCHAKGVAFDSTFKLPTTSVAERSFEGTVSRGVEVGYHFKIVNPDSFRLWQLGLTDVLSLAWEMTTLSFVADWFLGVGNFLRSLARPLGLDYHSGYETKFLNNNFYVVKRLHRIGVSNGYPVQVVKPGFAKHNIRCVSMHRVYLGAPAIAYPSLDLRLNLNQATSALALIAARIK